MPLGAIAEFFLVLPAAAEPLPQPKVGQCPSSYTESGGYCAPTRAEPTASRCGGADCAPWFESGPGEPKFSST
jgi:hypothetical protein